MPRALVWTLYAACVLIWSSTWVVIAVGLEDIAPFFGAGIRFSLAGVGLLVGSALFRRSLRTDWVLSAIVGLLPFATTYGLIYWAEQYVTSGLTAVLFGVIPLYVALMARRRAAGRAAAPAAAAGRRRSRSAGSCVAFSQSLHLGEGEHTVLAALAVPLSPLGSAVGNVAIKLRGAKLDPLVMNGWAMLGGGAAAARRLRADRGLGRDDLVVDRDRLDPLPRRLRHRASRS